MGAGREEDDADACGRAGAWDEVACCWAGAAADEEAADERVGEVGFLLDLGVGGLEDCAGTLMMRVGRRNSLRLRGIPPIAGELGRMTDLPR